MEDGRLKKDVKELNTTSILKRGRERTNKKRIRGGGKEVSGKF